VARAWRKPPAPDSKLLHIGARFARFSEVAMATMKAVLLESFGGTETLRVKEIERPRPGDAEVLIKVQAASVNPVDYKMAAGKYPTVTQNQLPIVLGRDISGTVIGCGRQVTDLAVGDEVYAMLDRAHGGFAEYVAVNADLCVPKPAKLDHAAAAAVPLAGITAWQGLFDHGRLVSGQRVLIHGGAGGVGHFAIQFAKERGANVSTTGLAQDKDFMRLLGADQTVDYTSDAFEKVVHGVDLVFDLVAADTQERSWHVLKDGGALVSTLTKPSEMMARQHNARATNYQAQPNAGELAEIGQLIATGKVKPYIEATFPLEEAGIALQRLQQRHTQGKIVLEVSA
jgi:NADPH:quinone reductase-like Zn-dependent oxidoreductase